MHAKTYDVVVLGFRKGSGEDPARAIARVIDVTAEEGESLIRNAPRSVRSNVGYAEAEAYAASLGLAGAEVAIAEHPFHASEDVAHAAEVLHVRASSAGARSTEPGFIPDPSERPLPPREPQAPSFAPPNLLPEAEPERMSQPERESRMMSVMVSAPRFAPRTLLRYAGMAVGLAAVYAAWLYLLDRF